MRNGVVEIEILRFRNELSFEIYHVKMLRFKKLFVIEVVQI